MKHPYDILKHHEQKHENSCVAWGLELVMKIHEKIGLNDYPLQNGAAPCDYGFGAREQKILHDYGITSKDGAFDLNDFEQVAKSESQKGFPLIFSIPNHLVIKNNTAHIIHHVWIAVLEEGSLQFLSRSHGHFQVLPSLPVAAVFHAFRKQVAPDYRIHCLLHS